MEVAWGFGRPWISDGTTEGTVLLKDIFPVFRAHPLLFQFILSLAFHSGVDALLGRLISAAFGIATVLLVYKLGERLYGTMAGLLAAPI